MLKQIAVFLLGLVVGSVVVSLGITARAQTISCGAPTTLSILPAAGIGSAYQNISYAKSLLPSGGTGPYTFSLKVGSSPLPAGLSIASSGAISGTPTAAGLTTGIIIQVQDSGGSQKQTATLTTSIQVYTLKSTSGISIPSTLTVAVGATSATQTAILTFTDGSTLSCASCVWMVGPGNPATVNSSTGAVTGINPGGTASVTTSFSGVTSNAEVVTVTGGTPPSTPTIVSTSPLPPAYSTIAYQGTTLAATGGTSGCCTWAITSGTLTGSGLSLNTSTGAITGTGSTGGTYSITVTATDGGSHTSPAATFNVTVNTVSSPVQLSLPGGATSATLSTSGTIQLNVPICTYSNGQGGNSNPPIACPSTLTYSSDSAGVATVNSTGLISAVGAGTAHITASVTGCATCTSNQITITVASGLQITTPATLPSPCDINFQCNSLTLMATGGSGTGYTWSITSGAPTGCGSSVTAAGVYSCLPTAAGTFSSFIIKVTDSMSNTASKTFTQVVGSVSSLAETCTPLTITQNSTSQCTATAGFSDGGSKNVSTGGSIGTPTFWNATNFSTTSLSVTVSPTVGQTMHACASYEGDNTHLITFTDNKSGGSQSWTRDATLTTYTAGRNSACGHFSNTAAITSVTATPAAGAAAGEMFIFVWAVSGEGAIDGSVVGTGSTADVTSLQSSAFSTVSTVSQIYTFLDVAKNQSSLTQPTGFTFPTSAYNNRDGVAYQPVSTTQSSITPTWSWPASTGGSGVGSMIFAFDAATTNGASWSATGGSVTSNGLATGTQAGTMVVSSSYGGKSASVNVTVQGQMDTSLVVSPTSGSATFGNTVQFTASGNVTGSSYTSTAGWQSTSTTIATSAGAGLFTCGTTQGTTTVTATFAPLNAGTATITCNPAVSGTSLLNGFTVSTTNTVQGGSIPGGWTLLCADGFDSGSVGCNEILTGGASVSGTLFHSGSHSLQINIPPQSSGCTASVCSPAGNLIYTGAETRTFHDFYWSWWRYFDASPGNSLENQFAQLFTTDNVSVLTMDTQPGCGSGGNCLWFAPQSNSAPEAPVDNNPNGQNDSFYGPFWHWPIGQWEQEELWIHPNTCTGGTNNLDGFVHFYINGVEQTGNTFPVGTKPSSDATPAGAINGCKNMTTAVDMWIEGLYTYDPVAGPPPYGGFNDYRDDVILMAK